VPLTPFQATVLRLLARNRSADSYVAGGIALNAQHPIRWSADVDLFHDVEAAVMRASDADVELLRQEGYDVRPDLWTPGFRRAWVARDGDGVRLEWCRDSAWRFFPIEPDELLGWKLHRFDALTNKALAMASRAETRDLVDLVAHTSESPLHAVVWAACTKDPGFGPLLLLNEMRRNSRIDLAQLREMGAAIDPLRLKTDWLRYSHAAEREIDRAASAAVEVGLAFVNAAGEIGWFDQSGYTAHRATLGGALPRVVDAG
jgi:hypothetical protein